MTTTSDPLDTSSTVPAASLLPPPTPPDTGAKGYVPGPGLSISMAVLTIAGAVVALAGVKATSGFLAPTLLPLFLVITFRPLSTALQRRGAPGWLTSC